MAAGVEPAGEQAVKNNKVINLVVENLTIIGQPPQ